MTFWDYIFCFFAGAIFANVVPHLVHGISGDRFPTPFAKPPGKGLSSPTLNVVWALFNLLIGYMLFRLGKVSFGGDPALISFFPALPSSASGRACDSRTNTNRKSKFTTKTQRTRRRIFYRRQQRKRRSEIEKSIAPMCEFLPPLASLTALRTSKGVIDGFRCVAKRSDLKTILFMVFWIGTFGLNFPIFISTMSVTVFHAGAHQFGLLTSLMAIGSVTGALLAAGRTNPRIALLAVSALCFGLGCSLAAVMPAYWLFGLLLIGVGISVQTFTTTANSVLQLSTEPSMRGRIVAMFMAIALGTTPIGAPIVGSIADHFGARWALGVGAASGFAAAIVGICYLARAERVSPQMEKSPTQNGGFTRETKAHEALVPQARDRET